MSRRFFSSERLGTDPVSLQGPEAHHLSHVMRARVGDEVVLFDGHGDEVDARVLAVARNCVQLEILSRRSIDRELPRTLELAVALPRGDRSEWLTQKLVELGVSQLTSWQTIRSVALPNAKTLQRLERQVVEASKQCGRNRLMRIGGPVPFQEFVNGPSDAVRVLAHPTFASADSAWETMTLSQLADHLCDRAVNKVVVGIGPEGGFTDEEVQRAQRQGWATVELGPRVLRTETAAIAIAAWLMLSWSAQDEAAPSR